MYTTWSIAVSAIQAAVGITYENHTFQMNALQYVGVSHSGGGGHYFLAAAIQATQTFVQ